MSFKIFYSWQTKTESKYNRNFIEDCLKAAVKQLKTELKDDSPDFYIDRDTKDVPGFPNIPTTVDGKIRICDVFVGDVTYVAYIDTSEPSGKRSFVDKILKRNLWVKEGVYSTNVAEELGTAKGNMRGSERIVTVMNTAYGEPRQLNFDSKQYRFPLTYHYDAKTGNEDKKKQKEVLVKGLKSRIKDILETEHERQKEYFNPFVTWKTWSALLKRPFAFERTVYINNIFETILDKINLPKNVFRLCGLSGIGKTRMLFECFLNNDDNPLDFVHKVLYIDANDVDEKDVKKSIKELIQREENKILIVDNCSKELHISLLNLTTTDHSKLSLLTISTDPEEVASQLEPERVTQLIILDNQRCKETVDKILGSNFQEFQEQEQKLLVDFSSGLAFIATLMAQNPERGKYQPGSLTRDDVVKRLLGPLYSDEISRSVVYACSLFSKFGFCEDIEVHCENIATCKDLFLIDDSKLNPEDIDDWRKLKFKEICKQLNERQLLEKKGRTFAFRPSPLAVRMAEDWWSSCNVQRFERILPVLTKSDLVESFCEQFRYLKHVENAKAIVKNLCDGFFSLAEVLNTVVGSRLFRSFVYVNPVACTDALTKAFLSLPSTELSGMKEGRRNLVWALEKLCFRPDTFTAATKVMAAFSIGENENIGNNATNQFLQLFHIHLPGTTVNLEKRWEIIEYCFTYQEYIGLGLKALNRCLKAEGFHRMGGAEDQGDPTPLVDYTPTGNEVYQYWAKAIKLLEKFSFYKSGHSPVAINILLDNFYSVCAHGGGKLVIPVFEQMLKEKLIDRVEARKKVQFILNTKRVYDPNTIENLSRIYDDLKPISFNDKFKLIVQNPSSAEYYKEEGDNDYNSQILKKIDALADEFIEHQEELGDQIKEFVSGTIYEGANFGKAVSEKLESDDKRLRFLNILANELKQVREKDRNISVLIGALLELKIKQCRIDFFNTILNDPELRTFSFQFARVIELPFQILNSLVDLVRREAFSIEELSNFNYGWGIKHLSQEEVIELINQIRNISDLGKVIAFFILARWFHNNNNGWNLYRQQLRLQLIEDSQVILNNISGTMDYFEWAEVIKRILESDDDKDLARRTVELIIKQINTFDGFYAKEHSFSTVMNVLQKNYFEILWQQLAKAYMNLEEYRMAVYHLKDLLGARQDSYANSEGILLKDNPDKFSVVFEWCKEHSGKELHWVVQLLPIYDPVARSTWHPFMKAFIDEFGDDKSVLDGISSKIGTYSWTGSVVPKLKDDRILFETLLNHKLKSVRTWAEIHIADLNSQIRWEENREQEEGF